MKTDNWKQPTDVRPDIALSTGRIVTHARMSNGAQSADIVGENPEMTNAEWLEYCGIVKDYDALTQSLVEIARSQQTTVRMVAL